MPGYLQTKVGASLIPDGIFNFFEPLLSLFSLFSPLSAEQCRYSGSVSQWADPPLCFSTELAEGLNVRDEVMVFDGF